MNGKTSFSDINFIQVSDVLISVFDVLGATSLFNSCTAKDIVDRGNAIYRAFYESSLRRMAQLLKITELSPRIKGRDISIVLESISSFSHIEFYGDTLVFICAIDKIAPQYKIFAYDYIIVLAADITRQMLESGLPVRGCIDCGLIGRTTDSMMIIGAPYVRSVRLSNTLEFAGTVISDNFMSVMKANKLPSANNIVFLDVPIKDRNGIHSTTYPCVDWLSESIFLQPDCNIEHKLEILFSAHGKSVDLSAERKIENTASAIKQMIKNRNGKRT